MSACRGKPQEEGSTYTLTRKVIGEHVHNERLIR